MTTLKCSHNAGFFSCTTLALIGVVKYFNQHKALPDVFDRTEQFAFYKKELSENIIPELFEEKDYPMEHSHEIVLTNEPGEVSFSDYSKFHFPDIIPFVGRYFFPSKRVGDIAYMYAIKYGIDFENTCAIFYRGNDKKRECDLTPYSDFINKAKEILEQNPGIRFLVQPDETEF